jgi:Cof subfamily protein (haloacid dehalogenase superfamily)
MLLKKNEKRNIKLIATDLDGTLLDSGMQLPTANREALERCAENGITIVVATGRSLTTLPQAVRDIKGLKWLACSNGAKIYDNASGEQLYAKYLSTEAINYVSDLLRDAAIMKEIFWRGTPYTDRVAYDDPGRFGVPERAEAYIKNTRVPVDGIADFIFRHADEIENINFIYGDKAQGIMILNALAGTDLFTLTSSFPFNYEIGGVGADKGTALSVICEELGIRPSEVMAIGDSSNDISMLEFAGVSVAMEGASSEVRNAADVVTCGNDENGVAFAIDTLLA